MNGADIGCGARKIILSAIGIDVARLEATDLSSGGNTYAEWVCDAHILPFKDNTLDYVISRHVLEHMNWKIALLEWIRCLKPNGIMNLVVPNPDHLHHPGHGIPVKEVIDYLVCLGYSEISFTDLLDNYSWGLTLLLLN